MKSMNHACKVETNYFAQYDVYTPLSTIMQLQLIKYTIHSGEKLMQIMNCLLVLPIYYHIFKQSCRIHSLRGTDQAKLFEKVYRYIMAPALVIHVFKATDINFDLYYMVWRSAD